MQHDNIRKKFHFGIAPSPKSTQGIQASNLKSSLIYFISIVFYLSAYKVSVIMIKIDLVIANFSPCLKSQVGGVSIFTFYTGILIYWLFIHNSFGEMFRSLL